MSGHGGWWVSFAITPVQGFIEAARSVRDLKTGSEMICVLVEAAIEAGRLAGGKLLYPVVDRPPHRHIPNQFVICFAGKEAATAGAESMRGAAAARWIGICGRERRSAGSPAFRSAAAARRIGICGQVKTQLDAVWPTGWDAGWDEQIKSYWDIRTLVLGWPEVTQGLHERLLGTLADPTPTRLHWDMLSAALNASKQVRRFPQDQGIGRAKCTMFGEWEQMGPGGDVREHAEFWRLHGGQAVLGPLRVRTNERLGAVALVKRFAPGCWEGLKGLLGEVRDTGWVALGSWIEHPGLAASVATYRGEVDKFNTEVRGQADTWSRYLLDDNVTKERPPDDLPKLTDHQKEAWNAVCDGRGAVRKAAKDAGLGEPPRYYAILAMDGDHIGKWLAGDFCDNDHPHDETYYRSLSTGLRDYAAKQVVPLVEKHQGEMVYAGGDDLLALLPLQEVMACAQQLRKVYPQLPGSKPTTATAGIVVCHYSHNLRDALHEVRQVLEEAKRRGRDLCGVRVLKRSGGDLTTYLGWRDDLTSFNSLYGKLRSGASDRWLHRLAQLRDDVANLVDGEPVAALITHFVSRSDETKSCAMEARALWIRIHSALDGQHTNLRALRHPPEVCPIRGDSGFWPSALGSYLDAVSIATFLGRGRD